jgi:phosphoglycerate dehydrogenase-like enzyme
MAFGKLVVIARPMEPESWRDFVAEKPAEWQITLVNPADGPQELARQLEDAQYLVTLDSGYVSPAVLEGAEHLKLIQTRGQGADPVVAKWALGKGVPIANAGGANTIPVAEGTVLLMLACLHRLLLLNQSIRNGEFGEKIGRKGSYELYDKTVGIVGFGNVGRRVAKLCYGFGANIIYFERVFVPYALRADFKARPVSLDELLSTADIVTLHVPDLESTRGMIGPTQLARMKASSYLINTSRGAVVDQDALIRALSENRIAGAGLDVWEPEPPDPKNPLLQMANVVATPHQVGRAWETGKRAYGAIWTNLQLVAEGREPLNMIREF